MSKTERLEREEQVTRLWRMFRNGRAYQSRRHLTERLPLYVRSFEGDQWPAPTKNTKNLPRPVVNKIRCAPDAARSVTATMSFPGPLTR